MEISENMEPTRVFMRNLPITPGYGGYVPVRLTRMGVSYNRDTSYCVKTFRNSTQRYKDKLDALRYHAATAEQLEEICPKEPLLRMIHDYYAHHHPTCIEADHEKKPLQEPPIPGWAGHLPRARVTELGCAVRYHVMAKQCYEDFLNMRETRRRGPFERYQRLVEKDESLKASRDQQENKQKHQHEDSAKTPKESHKTSPNYDHPTHYHGPYRPKKYLEPLTCKDSSGG